MTRSNDELEKLIKSHQIVIRYILQIEILRNFLKIIYNSLFLITSLLPYSHHPTIARLCIKYKVNMVTASYLSKEMADLNDAASKAGVTIINEVGVDPGIDHMLAMQVFDEVKEAGGVIESYYSYCGGLPAPEHANNSLRYKFNWSPRAVLLNTISTAKYLKAGKIIEIPGQGLVIRFLSIFC